MKRSELVIAAVVVVLLIAAGRWMHLHPMDWLDLLWFVRR